MSNTKHILLISYVFPPYYGIGGRRWAKHADELTKLGYTVHVICAKNPFDEKSLWTDIVENNPNIILYLLPSMFPKVLVKFNHNFFQKIAYKFWMHVLPLLTKGSHLDRTIFWKRIMLRKAKKIIQTNNIKHVICTGGPFGVMYFTTLLRQWFHDIFIINDFRDPWTWGPNWGFPDLDAKRMEYEKNLELKTIQNSNLITVPNLEMKVFMDNRYPNFKEKIIELSHFYDTKELVVKEKTKSNTIRLLYYGNIYHKLEGFLEMAAKILAKHKDKFTFDIYTDKTHHLKYFENHNAYNVVTYAQLPTNKLFEKIDNYDFVFIPTPDYGKNNISTKFFEIIYTKTPIIIFSNKGLAGEYIENNRLGIHADIENLEQKLLNLYYTKNFEYNKNFDITKYELKNIVKNLDTILTENNYFYKKIDNETPRNILITFDYELFLGKRSGTVENCLIKPTKIILDTLRAYDIKKTLFFVDTSYIKKLLEQDNNFTRRDYEKIETQLCDILKEGHLIFPHIHPHWIDAHYLPEINQWELSSIEKYRFHNIKQNDRDILFDFAIRFIKNIQLKAGVNYNISGYRAGGWCLQPFSDFKPYFIKYNLKYEFSVLKKFKNNTENVYFNYMNMPSKSIYNFENYVEIENKKGTFTEFSISGVMIKNKLENKILLKYLHFIGDINSGDGISVEKTEEQIIKDIEEGLNEDYLEGFEMISIELLKATKLKAYKQFIDRNSYTHFISHPKMISSHNIKSFKKLLEYVKNNYIIETDFEKMS